MELPVVDAEEQELRELGRQTDMAEGRPTSEGAQTLESPAPPAEEPGRPQPTPEIPPASSEPEPEQPLPTAAERERDERGRFKAQQENGEAAPPSALPPPTVEKKSRFAEAREREGKEQLRRERSWSALQQEKEQFRAQQAQWQEQRRLEALQAQVTPIPLHKDGIDIQGYQKAYQDFRQQAIRSDSPEDWRNSLQSLETVLELQNAGEQHQMSQQHAQYELAWRTDMDAAMSRIPDLQNPDTPLYQEVSRLVKQEPYLFYIPGGFHKAVDIATLLLAAGSDSELREENEKLRARLEELEHSSQPARGGPGRPPRGPQSQEEMSMAEEEAYLRDLTNREDSFMRR